MSKSLTYGLIALAIVVLLILSSGLYVVNETQQVIITQFGKPVGDAVSSAGLRVKIPFIQKANYFEKRWLEWDGSPNQIPTKDKKYIANIHKLWPWIVKANMGEVDNVVGWCCQYHGDGRPWRARRYEIELPTTYSLTRAVSWI